MKKILSSLLISVLSLGLVVGEAEAKRLGGGKSVGMQREAVAPRPVTPQKQLTPSTPPAAAPVAPPKRNWLGPIAGLAAGLGIAALLSHFGMGEGMTNFLMIALLAMAAIFVVRLLLRRAVPNQANPTSEFATANAANSAPPAFDNNSSQYAASNAHPESSSTLSQTNSAAHTTSAAMIPEGFDADAFVRIAKVNFLRMQAAHDARNLDDIKEFVSPEMFAEIKLQIEEEKQGQTQSAPQQTDVVSLNAVLLSVVSEGNRHIASVQFSGMISEVAGQAASPFDEVWHLSKPLDGSKGWAVSGIQQSTV
ncbi:MAG: TIM44-like domain-containing protein [Pseudomonadota bacterium]